MKLQAIESAATQNPHTDRTQLRKPIIFADAILSILRAECNVVNGRCLLDEDWLREHDGVIDFSKYALVNQALPRRIMPKKLPSLTVDEQADEGVRMDSTALRRAAKL